MKILHFLSTVLLVGPIACAEPRLETIDRVWSGHAVLFDLEVMDSRLYVGYYDASRQLTIASRPIAGGEWQRQKLDVHTGWDSHNYIALAVDRAGHLHVAGNMHNDPLVYFRTSVAGDLRSLRRIDRLVDPALERRMTYPVFFRDLEGRLLLKYRDGGSGKGNEIYVVYDAPAERWSHLLTSPIIDGEGRRNAYVVGPTVGPVGGFHFAWVWRDTPDAETNHDLSYARTRDFLRWERSDGTPLSLPITLANAEIVDPVPVNGGMINNNTVVGFDLDFRPVITYHKFDARGDTQIYAARRETKGWRIRQLSRWRDFRWDFRGRGSLDSRLTVSGAVPAAPGRIAIDVVRDGQPIEFLLDSRSLRVIRETPDVTLASELRPLMQVPEGMQVHTVEDNFSGFSIAWPTLPPNRDQPRTEVPAPTTLVLSIPDESYRSH